MSIYIIIYTGNEVLMKQIKTLKTKKAAAAAKGKKAPKQLDEATMKEVRIISFILILRCFIAFFLQMILIT